MGTIVKDLRNKLTASNAKVLAAPTLRTLNNGEVAWSSGSKSDSIKELNLNPTINRDGTITVKLRPQIRVFQVGDQVTDPNIATSLQLNTLT